jgi:hypothetical protein
LVFGPQVPSFSDAVISSWRSTVEAVEAMGFFPSG